MLKPLQVLLVEDNDDIRESLMFILEGWSCLVDAASDGAEGLRRALEGNYDAIILDLGLPLMNGLEVARTIARESHRPYLCAFTAYQTSDDRALSSAAGFDSHIGKSSPTALTELKAVVEQLKARPSTRA